MTNKVTNIWNIQNLSVFLENQVKHNELLIDTEFDKLKEIFSEFSKHGFLNILLPHHLNGFNLNKTQYHFLKKEIASYSGALAFLQTQHQTACQLLLKSSNKYIGETFLSLLADKKITCGMALSPHLYHYRTPKVFAKKHKDGYLLENITLNHVSGYGLFNYFILGFICGDKELYCLIPFENQSDNSLTFGLPQKTVVAASINTVSVDIRHQFIAQEDIILEESLGSFNAKSNYFSNLDSFLCGTLLAAKRYIEQIIKPDDIILNKVNAYINYYENLILSRDKNTPVNPIRAEGMRLCDHILSILRQVYSSRALISDNNFSYNYYRLCRERDLFSVTLSTRHLLDAYIEKVDTLNVFDSLV